MNIEKAVPIYAVRQLMASKAVNSNTDNKTNPILYLLCTESILSRSSGKHNAMNMAVTLGLSHVPLTLNSRILLSMIPVHCNMQMIDSYTESPMNKSLISLKDKCLLFQSHVSPWNKR